MNKSGDVFMTQKSIITPETDGVTSIRIIKSKITEIEKELDDYIDSYKSIQYLPGRNTSKSVFLRRMEQLELSLRILKSIIGESYTSKIKDFYK